MRQIFLPLRSNSSWFSTTDTRKRLEKQIKVDLILYDRLVIQDGRYRMVAGIDGQGFDMMLHGNSYEGERRAITFYTPGADFGVQVGGSALIASKSLVSYDVDFYPIFHDAGLLEADYIEWRVVDLADPRQNEADQQAEKDAKSDHLNSVLPENSYLRKTILRALYRDSLLANELRLPFCVDATVAPIIAWKQALGQAAWKNELPQVLFDCWVSLDLPDFGDYSWENIHVLRESDIGRDFRAMIDRLLASIEGALPSITAPRDIKELIALGFSKELLNEMNARRPTTFGTVVSLALNWLPLPYAGATLSSIRDLLALQKEQTSWISLTRQKPKP